ncbi:MAG: GNAT family N-acetyltransferase [Myxococcota bacterium]
MSAQVDSLLGLCGVRADAGQVLIVVRDDEVLGVGVLRIDGVDAEVVGLVTEPSHRHRGIGRQLVREMESRARRAGCHRLRVRLSRTADAAAGFFRALGFDETHVALDLEL